MHVGWERFDLVLLGLSELATLVHVLAELLNFAVGWVLTGKEERYSRED